MSVPTAKPSAPPQRSIWQAAVDEPERVVLVDPQGADVTAAQFAGRTNQAVHALRALGLGEGDTVAVMLPNSVEILELFLACLQAGWYFVPVNSHFTPTEVAHILSDSRASVLVVDEGEGRAKIAREAADAAGMPPDRCFALGHVDGFGSYTNLRDHQTTDRPEHRTLGDNMNYTSGTTGKPKGVRRPLLGMDPDAAPPSVAANTMILAGLGGPDNVHIVGSPLYHTAVLRYATAALQLGHRVVVMDKWTPHEMLRLIERHRVTNSHMVPTQFHRLLALDPAERDRFDVSSLRSIVHSAAPCPIDTKRKMIEWWGPVLFEYYAATEGGGTSATSEEWLKHPGTVGRAWPTSEIAIFVDGKRVGPGVIGTVYMKPAGPRFAYHGDAAKTEASRLGDFFTVGDVGHLDEDGYLFLSGRASDMIISGGVNIYPAEIEAALLSAPGVLDAAVFGIPDPDWGEQVKAVVTLVPDVPESPETVDRLLEHCRTRLAKFKMPRSIDFIDEMPRDPNGKMYKQSLKAPYWESSK